MKLLLFVSVMLIARAHAHSWLHCVKYDKAASLKSGEIDNSRCAGFPRDINSATVFGLDQGINYKPINERPCRSPPAAVPITYKKGEAYRLIWPAKNHQADVCTNAFIPDNQLKVFFYPISGNISVSDPTLAEWTQPQYLLQDFKERPGKGFQNCPDFCNNTDRAPCFGDLVISRDVGYYKALWYWEFNPGDFYTHCFDVLVSNSDVPVTAAPTSSTACADTFQQCGGLNWQGAKCCKTGFCYKFNDWYSQCVLSAPSGSITPTRTPTRAPSSAPQPSTGQPSTTPTGPLPTGQPSTTPTGQDWKLCYCKC